MDYGRLVLENLKKKGFYDDIGQFDVTDEVLNFFLYLQVEKKRNLLHSHMKCFQCNSLFRMVTFSCAS